jgi:hypothetical protein
VDGSDGSAHGGRADLCQFGGDARLGAPEGASADVGEVLLGLGIGATSAANVGHGLGHCVVGAAVAAWPAVALVGSYELLMLIIRSFQTRAAAVNGD